LKKKIKQELKLKKKIEIGKISLINKLKIRKREEEERKEKAKQELIQYEAELREELNQKKKEV